MKPDVYSRIPEGGFPKAWHRSKPKPQVDLSQVCGDGGLTSTADPDAQEGAGISSENLDNIQKMSQQEILMKQKEIMELLGKGRCDFLKNRGAQKMGRTVDAAAETAQDQGGETALGKSVSDANKLLAELESEQREETTAKDANEANAAEKQAEGDLEQLVFDIGDAEMSKPVTMNDHEVRKLQWTMPASSSNFEKSAPKITGKIPDKITPKAQGTTNAGKNVKVVDDNNAELEDAMLAKACESVAKNMKHIPTEVGGGKAVKFDANTKKEDGDGAAARKKSETRDSQEAEDSLYLDSLRFDFDGRVRPPKADDADAEIDGERLMEFYEGLHHHGDESARAGYNLPELLHLSMSAMASQRSMALRVLCRVLTVAHVATTRPEAVMKDNGTAIDDKQENRCDYEDDKYRNSMRLPGFGVGYGPWLKHILEDHRILAVLFAILTETGSRPVITEVMACVAAVLCGPYSVSRAYVPKPPIYGERKDEESSHNLPYGHRFNPTASEFLQEIVVPSLKNAPGASAWCSNRQLWEDCIDTVTASAKQPKEAKIDSQKQDLGIPTEEEEDEADVDNIVAWFWDQVPLLNDLAKFCMTGRNQSMLCNHLFRVLIALGNHSRMFALRLLRQPHIINWVRSLLSLDVHGDVPVHLQWLRLDAISFVRVTTVIGGAKCAVTWMKALGTIHENEQLQIVDIRSWVRQGAMGLIGAHAEESYKLDDILSAGHAERNAVEMLRSCECLRLWIAWLDFDLGCDALDTFAPIFSSAMLRFCKIARDNRDNPNVIYEPNAPWSVIALMFRFFAKVTKKIHEMEKHKDQQEEEKDSKLEPFLHNIMDAAAGVSLGVHMSDAAHGIIETAASLGPSVRQKCQGLLWAATEASAYFEAIVCADIKNHQLERVFVAARSCATLFRAESETTLPFCHMAVRSKTFAEEFVESAPIAAIQWGLDSKIWPMPMATWSAPVPVGASGKGVWENVGNMTLEIKLLMHCARIDVASTAHRKKSASAAHPTADKNEELFEHKHVKSIFDDLTAVFARQDAQLRDVPRPCVLLHQGAQLLSLANEFYDTNKYAPAALTRSTCPTLTLSLWNRLCGIDATDKTSTRLSALVTNLAWQEQQFETSEKYQNVEVVPTVNAMLAPFQALIRPIPEMYNGSGIDAQSIRSDVLALLAKCPAACSKWVPQWLAFASLIQILHDKCEWNQLDEKSSCQWLWDDANLAGYVKHLMQTFFPSDESSDATEKLSAIDILKSAKFTENDLKLGRDSICPKFGGISDPSKDLAEKINKLWAQRATLLLDVFTKESYGSQIVARVLWRFAAMRMSDECRRIVWYDSPNVLLANRALTPTESTSIQDMLLGGWAAYCYPLESDKQILNKMLSALQGEQAAAVGSKLTEAPDTAVCEVPLPLVLACWHVAGRVVNEPGFESILHDIFTDSGKSWRLFIDSFVAIIKSNQKPKTVKYF